MTNEELRAAIETALRRRDRRGVAALLACDDDDVDESIRATTARINDDALRALASACGLRPDGRDPADEVERLRAEVATAKMIAEQSDLAHRCAVDMANNEREVVATLRVELSEARAALRDFTPTCASGAIATWSDHHDEAPTRCDACRRDTSVEHEHAAALRAAGGGR